MSIKHMPQVDGTQLRVHVPHYLLTLEMLVPTSPGSSRATFGMSHDVRVTAESKKDAGNQLLAHSRQLLRVHSLGLEAGAATPTVTAAAIWVDAIAPLDEEGRPTGRGKWRVFEWASDFPWTLEEKLASFAAEDARD